MIYLINKFKNYLSDSKLKIIIYDNKINIVNYLDIIEIEKNKMIIKSFDKNIIIIGTDMFLKKLQDDELLIIGNINKLLMEDIDV